MVDDNIKCIAVRTIVRHERVMTNHGGGGGCCCWSVMVAVEVHWDDATFDSILSNNINDVGVSFLNALSCWRRLLLVGSSFIVRRPRVFFVTHLITSLTRFEQ